MADRILDQGLEKQGGYDGFLEITVDLLADDQSILEAKSLDLQVALEELELPAQGHLLVVAGSEQESEQTRSS